jgi:hypothetical protein
MAQTIYRNHAWMAKKSLQLMLVVVQGSGYKQAGVADADVSTLYSKPATPAGKPLATQAQPSRMK